MQRVMTRMSVLSCKRAFGRLLLLADVGVELVQYSFIVMGRRKIFQIEHISNVYLENN